MWSFRRGPGRAAFPRQGRHLRRTLQFPPRTAVGADLVFGDVGVVDPEVRGIPSDAASLADRDISEEQRFGDEAFKLEVAAGLGLAALAGVEPLALVAGRARERWSWRLECVHL